MNSHKEHIFLLSREPNIYTKSFEVFFGDFRYRPVIIWDIVKKGKIYHPFKGINSGEGIPFKRKLLKLDPLPVEVSKLT